MKILRWLPLLALALLALPLIGCGGAMPLGPSDPSASGGGKSLVWPP